MPRLYAVASSGETPTQRERGVHDKRLHQYLCPSWIRSPMRRPSPSVKRCLPAKSDISRTACRRSFSSNRADPSPASVSRARATTSSGVLKRPARNCCSIRCSLRGSSRTVITFTYTRAGGEIPETRFQPGKNQPKGPGTQIYRTTRIGRLSSPPSNRIFSLSIRSRGASFG
jgi:hypothetical protein